MDKWWHPDEFMRKRENLIVRMRIIQAIRKFFDDQGFLEVETPALQISPGMDTHIHGMIVPQRDVNLNHIGDLYLHTSPEFAMKKLLVAGCQKIYQICKVFRDGEDSPQHNREFTMIEWYRTDANYTRIMQDCEELLRAVAKTANITHFIYKTKRCDPFQDIEILTVENAFKQYAGFNLRDLWDRDDFAHAAQNIGLRVTDTDAWDDIFHAVMAEKIEPFLGMGRPCILTDYPISMAALARRKPDDPEFAERFELYVCGIELANAFGELTDPVEQRKRFEADMKEKQALYEETYPIDEAFLAALEYGMPDASGIALGIDRLVMLATSADNIENVLWTGKPNV